MGRWQRRFDTAGCASDGRLVGQAGSLVWNLAYGLAVTDADNPEIVDVSEPLRSMMVAEFKKPGRTVYAKA